MEVPRSRTKAQRAAGSATSKCLCGIIRALYGIHADNAVTIENDAICLGNLPVFDLPLKQKKEVGVLGL